MTPIEADALALTITQTWRNVAPAPIWVEELEPLHEAQARAAYVKLRRESENAPSIARFLAMYHTMPTTTREEPYEWRQPERIISHAQYMDELVVKAGKGDEEANEMLDIWADNEARNLSIAKFLR